MLNESLEFEKMPSKDFCTATDTIRLNKRNLCRVDFGKVKDICDKHGFGYSLVYQTFGGSNIEFILYYKTSIAESDYKAMRTSKDWNLLRLWSAEHIDKMLEMHQCVNELDIATDLFFDVSWSGNVGLFGSDNVRYKTYSRSCDTFETWERLNENYSLIYDFKMPRGVFLIVKTSHLKPDLSKCLFGFKIEDAFKVATELFPDKKLSIVDGNRMCDSNMDAYKAILIGEGMNQLGSLTIYESKSGAVQMGVRAVLGGETSTSLSATEYRKQIKDALEYIGVNRL